MFTTNTQLEEHKATKLIDRIYRGERINEDQFEQIWDLINKRGVKTKREEKYTKPVYKDDMWVDCTTETKLTEGKMYLGVFAYKTSDDNNLVFCDVRPAGGKMTRISHNKKVSPHLFWMGW